MGTRALSKPVSIQDFVAELRKFPEQAFTRIDEIIRFTGLRPALVHLLLVELSLAGRIERHPGQRVSLIQV